MRTYWLHGRIASAPTEATSAHDFQLSHLPDEQFAPTRSRLDPDGRAPRLGGGTATKSVAGQSAARQKAEHHSHRGRRSRVRGLGLLWTDQNQDTEPRPTSRGR